MMQMLLPAQSVIRTKCLFLYQTRNLTFWENESIEMLVVYLPCNTRFVRPLLCLHWMSCDHVQLHNDSFETLFEYCS